MFLLLKMGVSRRNRNVHYKFAERPQIRKTLVAQCSDGQRYCKRPLRNGLRNHMRMHLSFTRNGDKMTLVAVCLGVLTG